MKSNQKQSKLKSTNTETWQQTSTQQTKRQQPEIEIKYKIDSLQLQIRYFILCIQKTNRILYGMEKSTKIKQMIKYLYHEYFNITPSNYLLCIYLFFLTLLLDISLVWVIVIIYIFFPLHILYMSAKNNQKVQEPFTDYTTITQIMKSKNYIVQYVVSLSGIENQKIYLKHGFLGRGGFANCYITQLLGSNRLMATKIIDKNNLKSSRTKLRLINEIKIHKTFSHPNIVQFIHYFEDYDNVYIMLELCENQSLNQLLKERKTLTYPQVQSFLYGICNGVKYLHEKKYIHRDLKLGNIFLNQKFQIKIGDFGLTSQLQFLKQNKRTICGTPNYIAPEVLEGVGYYFQIDIWAIGIIIYTLFYGFPPFESESTSQIYTKIRKCEYKFPKNPSIPPEAISLIKAILVPKPENRISIDQILSSPFMKLGNGVPLQLPQCCFLRAPTKQQIESVPLICLKDNILKQNKKKINNFINNEELSEKKYDKSTIDRTVSRECNLMLTGIELQQRQKAQNSPLRLKITYSTKKHQPNSSLNKAPNQLKDKETMSEQNILEHVIDFEQIDQNAFFFCTSTYVLGTFEKDREICFKHLTQFQKNTQEIYQLKLYNNLFSERGTLPFYNYKYKSVLSIKAKQLISMFQKENYAKKKQLPVQKSSGIKTTDNLLFVSRVTQHKDLVMIKLSNKCIQVIYDTNKHGFFYEITSERLFFYEHQNSSHELTMKQLVLQNVIQTVKNYLKNSQKCTKSPNIQTFVSIVNKNEYVKIPIIKLRHIYGIISQLQTKKTKHGRNRNSQ